MEPVLGAIPKPNTLVQLSCRGEKFGTTKSIIVEVRHSSTRGKILYTSGHVYLPRIGVYCECGRFRFTNSSKDGGYSIFCVTIFLFFAFNSLPFPARMCICCRRLMSRILQKLFDKFSYLKLRQMSTL